MGYLVERWHYRPCYRRGDLEDESVIVENKTFKTRKEAKAYIESRVRGKNAKYDWHRGNETSTCYYYTNKVWTHENSGEECRECITYCLKKCS